jgi:UDP-GlcNAc:undecaprenyl-phosphate GlcNAc-1-phosphate transferase
MLPYAAVALCLIVSWMLLDRAALLANRFGLIDRPDGARKIHARPTPRIGGLAFTATLAILLGGFWAIEGAPDPLLLWGGALILFHFLMGAIDDRRGLPAAWRLILSIGACALMLAFNDELVIRSIRLGAASVIEFPAAAAFVVTVLGIVFFIFSVNLMDGRNGILGVNALWWLALLEATTLMIPIWAFVAVSGTLLLFLRFNLRGLLFAGDAGAYVVGSGVALLALGVYARRPDAMAFDQMMVLFLLPVLDAGRVLIRRLCLHMRPFGADNSHLHHVLWRRVGDRGAAWLYTIAIVVPSTLAMLLPQFAPLILAGAVGFFFLLIYWPTDTLHATARDRRYVAPSVRDERRVRLQAAPSSGRDFSPRTPSRTRR